MTENDKIEVLMDTGLQRVAAKLALKGIAQIASDEASARRRGGRARGKGFENRVCQLLCTWWKSPPKTFRRTPGSGNVRDDINLMGDVCSANYARTEYFPFVVEAKAGYSDGHLEATMRGSNTWIGEWVKEYAIKHKDNPLIPAIVWRPSGTTKMSLVIPEDRWKIELEYRVRNVIIFLGTNPKNPEYPYWEPYICVDFEEFIKEITKEEIAEAYPEFSNNALNI